MLARTKTFHQLHQSGCFVIPNPWDKGSARALAALGFKALATTSAGFAWATGEADHGVTLPRLMAHLRDLAGSVDVPISADFENGLADDPAGVTTNVAAAVDTGIAEETIFVTEARVIKHHADELRADAATGRESSGR